VLLYSWILHFGLMEIISEYCFHVLYTCWYIAQSIFTRKIEI
jgi:hypothetical protein